MARRPLHKARSIHQEAFSGRLRKGLWPNVLMATVLTLAAVLISSPARALTPAGTVIQSQATLNYTMSGINITSYSNTNQLLVDEVVQVSVSPAMSGTTIVVPPFPTTGELLYFAVTNAGNSSEDFALSVDPAVPGNDFDPDNPVIAVDSGTLGSYEGAATDPLYTGPIPIPAETTIYVWVISDIADTSLSPGDTGMVTLEAVHLNAPASTVPGTVYSGAGPGGTDLVLGAGGGYGSATGAYVVVDTALTLTKTIAAIAGTVGGVPVTAPVTGARITYQLDVIVTGSGTAASINVTDPIPANTTYVPGSMTLDPDGPGPASAVSLTDTAADYPADPGEFTGSAVTVRLGDLTAGTRTVTFGVTIN